MPRSRREHGSVSEPARSLLFPVKGYYKCGSSELLPGGFLIWGVGGGGGGGGVWRLHCSFCGVALKEACWFSCTFPGFQVKPQSTEPHIAVSRLSARGSQLKRCFAYSLVGYFEDQGT